MIITDPRKRKSRGLSLLEVIIAIGIAAIAVSSMVIFFAYVMESIRMGRSVAQATTLAQRYLEELKGDPSRITQMAEERKDPEFVEPPPEVMAEILYQPEGVYLAAPKIPIIYKVTTKAEYQEDRGERIIDLVVEVTWRYKNPYKDIENKKLVMESFYISDY